MSHSLFCDDHQNTDDSDATYCPEVEHLQKRVRKKTELFQSKSPYVTRIEQTVKNVIQRNKISKEEEAIKLLKKLKKLKPKNKGDWDAIFHLIGKLENFVTENAEELKYNCDRDVNENLNGIDYVASQEPPYNFCDAGTNTILNYVSPGAYQNFQFFGDSHNANETLNLTNYTTAQSAHACKALNSIKDEASQTSNYNFDVCYTNKPFNNIYSDFSTNEALNNISNHIFENFVAEHFISPSTPSGNDNPYFNYNFHKLTAQTKQQFLDKYITPPCYNSTEALNSASQIAENQTDSQTTNIKTCISIGTIPKRIFKRKAVRNHKNRCANQGKTQPALPDFFKSTEENKTVNWEELNVTNNMSPIKMKKDEIRPCSEEAVEMMESLKKKFQLHLKAKKEEILRLRTTQPHVKKEEEEETNSTNVKEWGGFQMLNNCKINDKEELLQNMRSLYEIADKYKEIYKSKKIDIFSD